MAKVIKTRSQYDEAMEEVSALVKLDPQPGTVEAEQLDLLSLLVEDYEARVAPAKKPTPLEAIRFRMDQLGLSQKDLVPFIGSRSKVSEILAGKRPLTLAMIRALHRGLGIPATVLLVEQDANALDDVDLDWARFPVREMARRGWVEQRDAASRDNAEGLLRAFFAPLGSPGTVAALCRREQSVRSSRGMDRYALLAWTARVLIRATSIGGLPPYEPGSVTPTMLRDLAQLSWSEQGPLLAREFLSRQGIPLIVEPHLQRTHLDGAAMLLEDGRPVVGLTIRHDRLDNFWFSLLHELTHIARHLDVPNSVGPRVFVDDLESPAGGDSREAEADSLAGEALIPEAEWEASAASRLYSPEAARRLASKLRVHPAIVAGRMRRQANNYRILSNLVGQGSVRRLFGDVAWE